MTVSWAPKKIDAKRLQGQWPQDKSVNQRCPVFGDTFWPCLQISVNKKLHLIRARKQKPCGFLAQNCFVRLQNLLFQL